MNRSTDARIAPTARRLRARSTTSCISIRSRSSRWRPTTAGSKRCAASPPAAPRRFNPTHTAWLPILHTERDGWHFTALFSNTARAHELRRTDAWVVVYFYDGDHREGQHTVVTETHGPLAGRRVVRGREVESLAGT